MNIADMRDARARLITEARSIMDAAKDGMSAEDETRFDKLLNDADSLEKQIANAQKLEEAERSLSQSTGRVTRGTVTPDADAELRAWLMGTGHEKTFFTLPSFSMRAGESPREFERRAQSSTVAGKGGVTVSSSLIASVEAALLAYGGVRSVANTIRTASGEPLTLPTLNDTGNMGRRIAEGGEAEEEDLTFSSVTWGAHKYTSDVVLVPVELLEDSSTPLAEIVGTALGERIARVQALDFTTGTGTNQPHGIVTASTLGHTVTSLSITYDDLVDLEHSVNPSYRNGARFMFSDAALRQVKKIKDDEGRPIWLPDLAAGAPGTILGYGFAVANEMAAPADGAKSVLYGDISKFTIRDVRDVRLVRLNERWAEFDSVGFIAWMRSDSRLVNAGTNPVKHLLHDLP